MKSMKKFLSFLLAVIMIISLVPAQVFAVEKEEKASDTEQSLLNYRDVQKGDWYYDAVQYAGVNGFFKGTSVDLFTPNGTMTRGMFVTVLGRMAGIDPAAYSGGNDFTDVSASAYYAPYVAWAAKYGITSGVGNGAFAPNMTINRQQMAAFFVRYFDAFDVNYDTGANIETVPADLDSVAGWAKDAVLKLWKQGLLNGDGVSFNPTANATRAQTATLGMRVDKAVETWYKEPGVPSERVSVDPTSPQEPQKPEETKKPGSSGGSGSGTTTTYYEVQFAMADGQSAEGVTLPQTKTYAAETKISSIPTPYKQNGVFLGWYYDAAMETMAAVDDTVTKNMTLYAKMGELNDLIEETPTYLTVEVAAGDVKSFNFDIEDYDEGSIVSFVNVSAGSEPMIANSTSETPLNLQYSFDNGKVSGLKGGQTYRMELAENSNAVFKVNGSDQPDTVRTLNIITEKAETNKLSLVDGMLYIPKDYVDDLNDVGGLFTASVTGQSREAVQKVNNTGTFTYAGDVKLQKGNIVAIYEGICPKDRTLETENDGAVAYVEITGVSGNQYTYKTADTEDVLFTPDILPVELTSAWTSVSVGGTASATVPESTMDYSSAVYEAMKLDATTTVDKGDFIVFYTGTLEEGMSADALQGYAEITAVTYTDGEYTIYYKGISEDTVLAAMDLYSTRVEEVKIDDEERKVLEDTMVQQALDSGFVDEAARYLTALALETDGFQELSDDLDWDLSSYKTTFADGTPCDPEALELNGGTKVEWLQKKVTAKVGAGYLDHFGKKGVNAQLIVSFKVELNDKFEISMQAVFQQELMLTINASGGAVWKKAWIFPYIDDYEINANIDMGSYTGINISATAKTVGEDEEEYDWFGDKELGWSKDDQKILDISNQLATLIQEREALLHVEASKGEEDNEFSGVMGGGLLEKYANMIENADDSWIELVRTNIFSVNSSVDPLHILCYGVKADFVISANMYVTVGMSFEYEVAKRYSFNVKVFSNRSSSNAIDLVEPHFNFDFFVMGTMGVKAGIELELAVGLMSLKLDSIGICAEAGAYAQLWGYFYYHYSWSKSEGVDTSSSGALALEIGIYLEISFKAQLFSSDKLTYQPTLYDNQWPLLTIGSTENVYGFEELEEADEGLLDISLNSVTQTALPSKLFNMNYLDLKTGDVYGSDAEESGYPAKNCDDASESCYTVEISNPKFRYEPNGNKIIVEPGQSVNEECDITFVWKNGTLAFTSRPISRTVHILWRDDANAHFIYFDTNGGSGVAPAIVAAEEQVYAPAAPTKQGYAFDGWFSDAECTQAVNFPISVGEAQGITLYAKWKPAETTYTAEYYAEELSGSYSKVGTATKTGITGQLTEVETAADAGYFDASMYTLRPVKQQIIEADGSTVVKAYLERKTYTIRFKYGDEAPGRELTYHAKYGTTVAVPTLVLGGYIFQGFKNLSENYVEVNSPDENSYVFTAKWEKGNDTPFRVEYYIQRFSGTYEPYTGEDGAPLVNYGHGTTGDVITEEEHLAGLVMDIPGFTYDEARTTINGKTASDPFKNFSIKNDGSTVVKLFYNRDDLKLTVKSALDGNDLTTVDYKFGAKLSNPDLSSFTKAGYERGGLYSTSDCSGNALNFEQNPTTMPAGGMTVYLKWVPKEYTITFDSDDGSTVNPITQAYGTTITAPAQPTKAGCTFDGWYNGETKVDFTNYTMPLGGATLKAHWNEEGYTITLNIGEGASYPGGSTSINYKVSSGTITLQAPTKAGYTFTGWTGEGITEPTKNVTILEGSTGNRTYTANWMANTYTLSFDLNYEGASNPDSQTVTYDAKIGSLPVPANREGYTFAGWFFGDTDEQMTAETVWKKEASNPTLKAHWTANTYTLTWNFDGGNTTSTNYTKDSVAYNTTIIAPAAPTKTGYSFAGWYNGETAVDLTDYTMPATDMTLTAHWTVNSYTLTWNFDGGETTSTNFTKDSVAYNTTIIAPAAPTKTGYIFAGWYNDETKVDFTNYTMPAADITLKAKWTANTYTLSFNLNYEGATNPGNQTVTYDAAIGTLPTPGSREGYGFMGWYYMSGETKVTVTDETEWTVAADTTLLADWVAGETYTITYNGLEGASNPNPERYNHYSAAITLSDPQREGYTFTGWTGEGIAMPTKGVTIAANSTGDRTYTANWTVNSYTLTWDVDSGSALSGEYTKGSVAYNTPITAPAAPTKTGHTFDGWYNGETKVDFTNYTMPAADTTLKAKWSKNSYTLTWNLGEGVQASGSYTSNGSVEYGASIVAPTLSKTGYTYQWQIDGEVVATLPTSMPAKNLTITAVWTANTHKLIWGGIPMALLESNGDYTFDNKDVAYGTAITPPTLKQNVVGYSVTGWTVKIGEKVTTVGLNELSSAISPMPDANVEISLNYTVIKNSVTLAVPCNSGVTTMIGTATANGPSYKWEYTIDDQEHTLPTVCTYGEKSFAGWYTDTSFDASKKVEKVTAEHNGKTLYAKFTFDVTLKINHPTGGSFEINSIADYPSKGDVGFKIINTQYIYGKGLNLMDSSYAGFMVTSPDVKEISGWYVEGDPNQWNRGEISATEVGDLTYIAKWGEPKTDFTVTLSANGVPFTDISGFVSSKNKKRPRDLQLSADGQTLTFKYKAGEYTADDYLDPATLKATKAYHVNSKYLVGTNNTPVTFRIDGDMLGNRTVKLNWTPIRYSFEYHHEDAGSNNVGHNSLSEYYSFTYDDISRENPTAITAPSCNGKDFLGWYTTADFREGTEVEAVTQDLLNLVSENIEVTVDSSGNASAKIHLYSKWEDKKIQVTWDFGYSAVSMDGNKTEVQRFAIGDKLDSQGVPLPKRRMDSAGKVYVLEAWQERVNSQYWDVDLSKVLTKPKDTYGYDIKLYAKWSQYSYSPTINVEFYDTDGTTSMGTVSAVPGEYLLSIAPKNEDSVATGWRYDSPSGSAVGRLDKVGNTTLKLVATGWSEVQ